MNLLYNQAGRLRSGWRFIIFILALYVAARALRVSVKLARATLQESTRASINEMLTGSSGFLIQGVFLLIVATFIGWLCGRLLENLPLRAFGWSLHRGAGRDLLFGALVGSATLIFAALIIFIGGGFSFVFNSATPASITGTLLFSLLVFIFGAAGEEALFRGYPLQTMLRSHPVLIAAIPSSLLFAAGHLDNPQVAPIWTFLNTALAGIWLAVAYLRTRSLWFPLGVHFSWNWMMASVLGIPVSGITSLAPQPLLRATETGADWFTGGSYGIEGGAVCTFALIVSTIFIRRTKWLRADEEMLALTSRENTRTTGGVSMSQAVSVE